MLCKTSSTDEGIEFSYVGPDLDQGYFPTIFYFALSAEDSLCKSPYNQPVQFLSSYPIRIFSLTIPCHDLGLSPAESIATMAQEMRNRKKPVQKFLKKIQFCISFLENKGLLKKEKLGLMGLSRGAFIATHIAAQDSKIPYLLQFSPLTKISNARDFKDIEEIASYDVQNLTSFLYDKTIRMYIGNRDLRVGTKNAFAFCEQLVEKAFSEKIRSPNIELRLFPSIGHQGHGTSFEIFNEGAQWLANQLR